MVLPSLDQFAPGLRQPRLLPTRRVPEATLSVMLDSAPDRDSSGSDGASGLIRGDRDAVAVTVRRVRKGWVMLEQVGPRRTAAFVRVWRLKRRLQKRLHVYRSVLTAAWSNDTRYRGAGDEPAIDLIPSTGQCGVSSAWLLRRLGWSLRRRANYCVGYLCFGADAAERSDLHCWIEVGGASSAQRLIIDVTADQFSRLRHKPVLCERYEDLLHRSIQYQADARLTFRELRDDDVWRRYEVLAEATRRRRLTRLAAS